MKDNSQGSGSHGVLFQDHFAPVAVGARAFYASFAKRAGACS
jgi:hypothetical protein